MFKLLVTQMDLFCGVLAGRYRDIDDDRAGWSQRTSKQLGQLCLLSSQLGQVHASDRPWDKFTQFSGELDNFTISSKEQALEQLKSLMVQAECLISEKGSDIHE